MVLGGRGLFRRMAAARARRDPAAAVRPPPMPARRPDIHWPDLPYPVLRLLTAALIGLAIAALALTLSSLRNDTIAAAQRDTDNIAFILADQIDRSVTEIDGILRQFSDRAARAAIITEQQFAQGFGAPELFDVMRESLGRLPQAIVLSVIDSHARLLNSTRTALKPGTDFSDRDFYQYLSRHGSPDLYVSAPVRGRATGKWIIFFTRRINGGFGDFVGLVTVGVPIEYFQRAYESIGAVAGQAFLLVRKDGVVLVRYPDRENRIGAIMPAGSPWYDLVRNGGGHYRSPGYFDSRGARLISVRPLQKAPLVADVGMSESAALGPWRRRTLVIGLGAALAVICATLLLRAVTIQFRRLADSQASLAESKRELESVNRRLDAALNNMSNGLAMFDASQRLLLCNARFIEIYRLSPDAIQPGCTLLDALKARAATNTFAGDPGEFAAMLSAQMAAGTASRFDTQLPDGRIIEIANHPAPDGGWVSTHEDVTERVHSEARIARMARYDALTDLPNRLLFRENMEKALADLQRGGSGFAVFIFDLDLFKAVNDSLGHPIGDALLKAIADRLTACARDCAVARLGGDEFAVIQTSHGDQAERAIALAETLLQAIGQPYDIEGHPIVIGISIGIALAPRDGTDAGKLLKHADLALYRAKADGRKDYRFFSPEMDEDTRLRHELELDLRNGLARDQFEIDYQLVLDVGSRRFCGAEALVRWRHPTRGLLGPDRFIGLAEDIGFINPLGEWVLRRACMDAAKWPAPVKVAVNLSPVQFRTRGLVNMVRQALADAGLPPERLELEITESVLLQKDADNLAILRQLGELGVGIVLDDFGTGYSSLSYLRLHRFSKIKIDKSFIAEMPHRSDCAAIVCTVIGLARSLDVATTAEGVETTEQFELLRAAGCTQVQGFLFSTPASNGNLRFDLDDRQARGLSPPPAGRPGPVDGGADPAVRMTARR